MRPALITLLPMLTAAGLVLLGGERLARKEIEERTPADRDRLFEFSATFDDELDRLDTLYASHLERLASSFGEDPAESIEEEARGIPSIQAMHFFSAGKEKGSLRLTPFGSNTRLPEIVVEERDRPLNPDNAVILPKELLDWAHPAVRGRLPAPRKEHLIYWSRPNPVRVVVFVIDRSELHHAVEDHLKEWMPGPLTPLREAGERVAIHGPSGQVLISTGPEDRGPAALLMPFRNGLGDWKIQAWDGVTVTTTHDTATLTTTGTVAAILALGGLFLWLQQRHALQLAEERVSFVNRVSHELGSPLTNVALNLDLATEAVDANPSEARHRLSGVTEEIERLGRLVANVLTFSRRERRTLELDPQPCNPDQVIGKTLDSFRPALRRREIEIEWQAKANLRVRLDPDALGQIVGNLFSNIEKYAAEGRLLRLKSNLEAGVLVVEVSDLGPGIPLKSRQKIFQPFERVHRKINEGSSGTGLGLTIARELATRMNGSLELLASEAGTRFALRVPAPRVLTIVQDDESSAA